MSKIVPIFTSHTSERKGSDYPCPSPKLKQDVTLYGCSPLEGHMQQLCMADLTGE